MSEVEGIVRRVPKQDCVEAQIWERVPNHLRKMEATVFFGTFNAAEMFWYASPGLGLDAILSRTSTDNSFDPMAWFML